MSDQRRQELTFQLRQGGRQVVLASLSQSLTYDGLLEGVPTSELNGRLIARHQRNFAREERPLAVLRPREYSVPDLMDSRRRPAMAMPDIQVFATFTSLYPVAGDTSAEGSHLTVLWYQDAWALPIDPNVHDQLCSVDWNASAHDPRSVGVHPRPLGDSSVARSDATESPAPLAPSQGGRPATSTPGSISSAAARRTKVGTDAARLAVSSVEIVTGCNPDLSASCS